MLLRNFSLAVHGDVVSNSNLSTSFTRFNFFGHSMVQAAGNSLAGTVLSSGNVDSYIELTGNTVVQSVFINDGSFFTNDYDLTITDGRLGSYPFSSVYLDLGTSNISVTGSDNSNLIQAIGDWWAREATITLISASASDTEFFGGYDGIEFGTVIFSNAGVGKTFAIRQSVNFETLEVKPGVTLKFNTDDMAPPFHELGTFIANGTNAQPVTLRGTTLGKQFILSKPSGTVNATYIDLKDSIATGGATWNAVGGTNSGNNSGWNFLPPPIPTWGFVDSTASAFQPTLTPGVATMSPTFVSSSAAVYSPSNTMFTSQGSLVDSTADVFAPVLTQLPPPPPPPTDWEAIGKEDEKVYVYKVYKSDGTFIGIWNDVRDPLMFTRKINTPGTTTTVILARSPNTVKEVRASMTTEAGEPITTEDGERLTVTYETNNSVGEGTDVDINYKVDVYVHYGDFNRLVTEAGGPLTTEDGEYLLVASGAPSGVRVFSGTILDYKSTYDDQTGVTVTLASHGLGLSHELVRSGETTTVSYSSQALQTTLKSILDTNPQVMSYSTDSIAVPGVSSAFKFELTTKLEAIERIHEQTPDGWYWSGDVADNYVYMQPTASTPHHVFKKGYHVKSLDLTRSKEQLINRVYFIGGEVGGVPVFKKYEDAASIAQWGVGLHRIVDRRFTDAAAMERKAMKLINRFKSPIYTTPITISSARYDLESIKEGQVIGFSNYDNFVDDLLLQIVSLSYEPTAVIMQVGDVLQTQHERIEEIGEELQGEQYQNLPTAPV
ncbi:hypothetical protein AR689_07670 [Arthrobacter sp. EpRS71]|nr:hypothetical protein AR689_07670 [Arthrobacter sp. EpRS71]